jgi:hypothetical protein
MQSVTHSSRAVARVVTQRQIVVHATSSIVACGVSHAASPRQTKTMHTGAFPRIPTIFGRATGRRQVF